MAPPPNEHDCGWREYAKELEQKLEKLERVEAELAELKRHVFGKKSEKLPPMDREIKKDREAVRADARRKRKERAVAKTQLLTETIELRVPDAQRSCPKCGNSELRSVGDGKPSVVYDYVPAHFVRRVFRRETLSCRCGEYIVNAPAPDRVTDGTRYGPGFIAHLIVSKCADSIPLYRLEKQYRRLGIPIARSTMTDLFHRHAELLSPLPKRILERIAASDIVQADETTMRLMGTSKKAWLWTFIGDKLVGYRFSTNRSGDTPKAVLGGTKGTLVVDAYTGYNHVTRVDGRTRAGCLAHARRKLFAARELAPEADEALELIRQVYVVEHEAKETGVAKTDAHLEMRRSTTRPVMDKLHNWLVEHQGLHPPKSKMGTAVRYALDNWTELTRFLDDARVPPDNNESEARLRTVALGRKNFLFVGHEDAGDNIAGLYSLVASCEAQDKNPYEYLCDVLVRVSSHPAERIDELLPDRWEPVQSA